MSREHQPRLFDIDTPPWEQDDADELQVATVVVPDGPPHPLSYLVPDPLRGRLQIGCRVKAPLGRGNRLVTGYCVALENQYQGARSLKRLSAVLDDQPLVAPRFVELTRWISDYYLCSWSAAIEAAVPSGVRNQAGTREVTFLSAPRHVAGRIDQLDLPPKQLAALRSLVQSAHPLTPGELAELAGCSPAPIQALRQKKLVTEQVRRIQQARRDEPPQQREEGFPLNDRQQAALQCVLEGVRAGRATTTLLHGVTGSGKTEVYIRAIDEVIRHGKQAVVLVPEISLTPQTRQRFRSRFDRVAVLHSQLSGPERHWHWQRIAAGEVQVVVGARSAVFAPTPRLGLMVLDEEHDASFKQGSAPHYHAREIAMWRTRQEGAALVLGSATPSLESLQRCQSGHYRRVLLPRRVLDRPLPDVSVIDLRVPAGRRAPRGAVSRTLQRSVDGALREGGQVILLLNRRGYSTNIQCNSCGNVVNCPDCDISLTHHLQEQRARCHYCDYETDPPHSCPACGFEGIRYSGLGTQKLEAEVRAKFPGVECLRMDSDTMRKHGSHERALARFRAGEARILLGTQMIAKGLDFPDVTLVGVINADTALHFPDFRAAERTFQLVTQVAGRTGRGGRGGRVLVQTFSPDHPAILAAQRHDYDAFAAQELPLRRSFGYPPFAALARLVFRGAGETSTKSFAEAVAEQMRSSPLQQGQPAARLLGPAPAPRPKLRGQFRFHLLLTGRQREQLRELVRTATSAVRAPPDVQWVADVDPLDML